MEEGLPEEQSQGLEKGLEVVVVIYCCLIVQLDVSKHLRQQTSRWWLLNAMPTFKVPLNCQNELLQHKDYNRALPGTQTETQTSPTPKSLKTLTTLYQILTLSDGVLHEHILFFFPKFKLSLGLLTGLK